MKNAVIMLITALKVMEEENAIHSKILSRRNWVIRVEDGYDGERRITYRGNYGVAARRRYLEEIVSIIAERRIRWYEFSLKKDYEEAVKKLVDCGVRDFYGELRNR